MPLFSQVDAVKLLAHSQDTYFKGTAKFLCDLNFDTNYPTTLWALYYFFDSIKELYTQENSLCLDEAALAITGETLDDIQLALNAALKRDKPLQESHFLAARLIEFIGSQCQDIHLCPAPKELIDSCVVDWKQRDGDISEYSVVLNIISRDNFQQKYPVFSRFLRENFYDIRYLTFSDGSLDATRKKACGALDVDMPRGDFKWSYC